MKRHVYLFIFLVCCTCFAQRSYCDYGDLLSDPLGPAIEEDDSQKTPEELLLEAQVLLQDERPLDARTKLYQALKKDPENSEAHSLLAGYYLVHVGHFRLALKHLKRAMQLFEKQNGPPPYEALDLKSRHAHNLNLLSQIRLNLDNYQGALDALDEFASYDYYLSWYPGSRAWILMKLGRIKEAIVEAQKGLLMDAEPGRTLNILGILYSMSGEREVSLAVFKKALAYEYSLGKFGQPATPLNNSGEVYREIFSERDAEKSWMKATSLPDGCEHVLPALNLATVQLEQLKFRDASRTMDNFESCVAQYPLRNGEEHRALVHLIRGRIAIQSGDHEEGISHLEEAFKRRQWFGKIGTSEDDLKAAVLSSLALALKRASERLELVHTQSWIDWFTLVERRITLRIRSWWFARRAKQVLLEDLHFGEDLYVRNTDSMLEYPALGTILKDIPLQILEERLHLEDKEDDRPEASLYYTAYLAEAYLYRGKAQKALELLDKVIRETRHPYDNALQLHALLLRLSLADPTSDLYRQLAYAAFQLSRAALPDYGLKLPVNLSSSGDIEASLFSESPFLIDNRSEVEFIISHSFVENLHSIRFTSRSGLISNITVQGADLDAVISQLADQVFHQSF
ncbi:MAG: tetratricopeptide repeat protein [Bdellovibrionales bacterium]|nr:tetratricopeptide repeat protein [Bdellovibrionales bacterium]